MDAHTRSPSRTSSGAGPICQTCKRSPEQNGDESGLRRGMCRACYLRAWRGTELPAGAACAVCPERRRVVLRWTRIGQKKVVTCQNCGFLADRARPKPRDVAELKERMARERRRARDRRRNYVIEVDDPGERRLAARRARRRSG